jgi:hypothetical protein
MGSGSVGSRIGVGTAVETGCVGKNLTSRVLRTALVPIHSPSVLTFCNGICDALWSPVNARGDCGQWKRQLGHKLNSSCDERPGSLNVLHLSDG